ncbi:MAG: arsenite methyltransferase [Bacteroidales bacterium]|nr:arsenite methyltransferase [Bacteroidales bacterium]
MKSSDIKFVVQEKYGKIVKGGSCCSGVSCCGGTEYNMSSDEYLKAEGYNPDADFGLGCGIPVNYAAIREGDQVLDLGSGAGNDCFVARAFVGESGEVTGLDITEEMVAKARENCLKKGYTNLVFVKGDIESMPLPDNKFDVVLSNCVLNLVPDKYKAFSEIFRVLKPGGHFCISDVVTIGNLPDKMKSDVEMYVGCVAGAELYDSYLDIIAKSGFISVAVHKKNKIDLPENVINSFLTKEEADDFLNSQKGIFSITVTGVKPQ